MGSPLYQIGQTALRSRAANGDKVERWFANGYMGTRCGGVALGQRSDGTLLQLSSDAAFNHWREALPEADNVSRIDFQLTIQVHPAGTPIGDLAYLTAKQHKPRAGVRPTVTRVQSDPGGTTVYLGAPSSDLRHIIYDKAAESGGDYPPGAWRYEVRYRAKRAADVVDHLRAASTTQVRLANIVKQSFKQRGIEIPVSVEPGEWVDRAPPNTTTLERRKRWLETQVQPAIEWCRTYLSDEEISELIGLPLRAYSLDAARIELKEENNGR
jgi:hypothetical protein